MSTPHADTSGGPISGTMGSFERYVTLWVALCIIAGITLGHLHPGLFQFAAGLEIARVNMPEVVEALKQELASMRPSLFAKENSEAKPAKETEPAGFNEAFAIREGKPTADAPS